jgi:hypothetical protein
MHARSGVGPFRFYRIDSGADLERAPRAMSILNLIGNPMDLG